MKNVILVSLPSPQRNWEIQRRKRFIINFSIIAIGIVCIDIFAVWAVSTRPGKCEPQPPKEYTLKQWQNAYAHAKGYPCYRWSMLHSYSLGIFISNMMDTTPLPGSKLASDAAFIITDKNYPKTNQNRLECSISFSKCVEAIASQTHIALSSVQSLVWAHYLNICKKEIALLDVKTPKNKLCEAVHGGVVFDQILLLSANTSNPGLKSAELVLKTKIIFQKWKDFKCLNHTKNECILFLHQYSYFDPIFISESTSKL